MSNDIIAYITNSYEIPVTNWIFFTPKFKTSDAFNQLFKECLISQKKSNSCIKDQEEKIAIKFCKQALIFFLMFQVWKKMNHGINKTRFLGLDFTRKIHSDSLFTFSCGVKGWQKIVQST